MGLPVVVEPLTLVVCTTAEASRCVDIQLQVMSIGCARVNKVGPAVPVWEECLPPGYEVTEEQMACWYCSGCKTEYTDEGEEAPFGCVVGPRSGPVQQ